MQGPPLFDLLDDIESAARDAFAPFRMPIMDRYRREGWLVGVADGPKLGSTGLHMRGTLLGTKVTKLR